MNEEDRRRSARAWNDPPMFSYDELNKQPSNAVPLSRRYKYPAPDPTQMYGYQPGQQPNMAAGAGGMQQPGQMYGGAYNSNQMAQMSQQMQPMPMQSNPNIPSPYISGWSYSQAQPMPGTSYDYAMQNPSAYPTPGTQSSPISYNLTQSYSTQPAYSAAPPGGQAMSVQSGYVPPTTQMPPNPYAPGAGGPIPPNVSINSYAPPDQGGPVPPGNYSAPGYQPYPGNYYPQ